MLDEEPHVLGGIRRVVFISPHPDDAELCCGIIMTRFLQQGTSVRYVCVTDGAPRVNILNATPRPARKDYDRDSYKSTRRAETHAALQMLGVSQSSVAFLDYPDLETVRHIPDMVADFSKILATADAVFCTPFEGGHPDHDICRFALAVALAATGYSGAVFEYASYNNLGYQVFAEPLPPSFALVATSDERRLQQGVASIFKSQGDEPGLFAVDRQVFRAADSVFELGIFETYGETPYYERFAFSGAVVLAGIKAYLDSSLTGNASTVGENN